MDDKYVRLLFMYAEKTIQLSQTTNLYFYANEPPGWDELVNDVQLMKKLVCALKNAWLVEKSGTSAKPYKDMLPELQRLRPKFWEVANFEIGQEILTELHEGIAALEKDAERTGGRTPKRTRLKVLQMKRKFNEVAEDLGLISRQTFGAAEVRE
jgi:hypothetical protein